MFFSKKLSLADEFGQEAGAVHLEQLWSDIYCLKLKKILPLKDPKPWLEVIQQALHQAQNKGALEILVRVFKNEDSSFFSELLKNSGFVKRLDRIEYKRKVQDLPSDEGSCLQWKTAQQLGWEPKKIAEVVMLVSQGDPGAKPQEDPLEFIQDFLVDAELTAGLDCIHIGFLGNEVAALTVVQMNPETGWSRISYMGVLPQFRRKGLGKWVHRYSFKVMKERGGQLYHGGTCMTNLPMIHLFKSHGCEKFCEMQEWSLMLKAVKA